MIGANRGKQSCCVQMKLFIGLQVLLNLLVICIKWFILCCKGKTRSDKKCQQSLCLANDLFMCFMGGDDYGGDDSNQISQPCLGLLLR